jgi:dTDP-4-dehydrorhamnose reductase
MVTGAAGQVGFELVRALAPLGLVRAFDRGALDLGDAGMIRDCVRALKPSLIVNAGAYTAVDAAETDVERCRAVNAVAPGILASEAARVGAALVHYSTDYVFDGEKTTPYVEEDVPAPLSVYGMTKLEGEQAIAASPAPYLVLRTSWVFDLRGRNFVTTMLRLFREREELSVVDDQHGAPTWGRMLAQATATIIAERRTSRCSLAELVRDIQGIYHLASAGETTWHGFATAIRELDPRRAEQKCGAIHAIPTAGYPTPARRPLNSVLDSSLIATRCGVSLPQWRDQLALCLADAA